MMSSFPDVLLFVPSFVLLSFAILGFFFTRENLILILISIELLILACMLNFAIFSSVLDDVFGQVTMLFILTVAAGESAIGLALVVIYYRLRGVLALHKVSFLKG